MLLALLLQIATMRAASAEPYLALRSGLPCAACHVNQTGGGMRTPFGVDYGLTKLPAHPFALPEGIEAARGVISSFLSMGTDLRLDNQSRFAHSADTNTFQTREGNLYADLQPVKDRLHLYLDVHVAPGSAFSREVFAMLDRLPGKIYVKAGRFFPPFGWRLQDDAAFIRARTGFNSAGPDEGIEVGWQPGRFSSSLSITNGSSGSADANTNKKIALLGTWVRPKFRIGGSFTSNSEGGVSSLIGGFFGGIKLGQRFVALAELNGRRSEDGAAGETRRQVLGFAESDVRVGKGWNLKAAYDYDDPDASRSGDEVNRLTAGAEYFATQYLQLRALWRRTDRPPEVLGVLFEDDREVVLELHLFL